MTLVQNPGSGPGHEPAKRGRPVNEGLVPQILQVAGDMFLDLGYQGTTMEAVARAVGMSKLTLYKRFSSKEELFSAIVRDKCNQFIPDNLFDKLDDMPVREALFAMGGGLLRLLNSHEAMTIEVMLRAEGDQTLRDLFFAAGPDRMKSAMSAYFGRLKARGQLNVDDPMMACHLFSALFKGSDIHMRCGLQVSPAASEQEIDAYVSIAVDFFLKGCCD
ncbi:TetR/AcrR family transcriptional regulator [Asticcacaulis sp. AC402]|uniref:TetR/AcrR family transcriptional regulator n=1 Tax=Asticcacaulis sp. AC402 TaxID=1282361 RepID=UPI0003C3E022|nr:TetR/AcrR family transcriptional regulator [Asticcacaulis sp. AC402]ESQ74003.1 hypothetical protein ABAC402_16695 [Asticcacaulis sp. AC402]